MAFRAVQRTWQEVHDRLVHQERIALAGHAERVDVEVAAPEDDRMAMLERAPPEQAVHKRVRYLHGPAPLTLTEQRVSTSDTESGGDSGRQRARRPGRHWKKRKRFCASRVECGRMCACVCMCVCVPACVCVRAHSLSAAPYPQLLPVAEEEQLHARDVERADHPAGAVHQRDLRELCARARVRPSMSVSGRSIQRRAPSRAGQGAAPRRTVGHRMRSWSSSPGGAARPFFDDI